MKDTEPTAILLGKHHDLTSFASTDASRYVIQSVHYHAGHKLLEATNGRILIRVPVEEREAADFPVKGPQAMPADCIIPLPAFKKAIGNIPNGGSLPSIQRARLDAAKDGENIKVILSTTDLESEQAIKAKAVEGQYPNCDMVIPTEPAKLTIALGSELLLTLATYAKKHGKETGSGGPAVTFEFRDGTDPVRFSVQLEGSKATGVLMPMRLA